MWTIKELRIRHCKTQQEVMSEIGIKSRSNYSKIENKRQKPSLRNRAKLAKLFGVNPWEIDF